MDYTIRVVRGTTKTITIEPLDADGNPYSLADGDIVKFGVKAKAEDSEYLIYKEITESADGVCTVELAPGDTIGLNFGRHVYDVGLQSGDNYYNVIPVSAFVVAQNVTKWGGASE